jgi:hypothetical protein
MGHSVTDLNVEFERILSRNRMEEMGFPSLERLRLRFSSIKEKGRLGRVESS